MNTRATLNNLALPYSPYQNGQNPNFNRERPPAEDSRREVQARSGSAASDYVFRGELLDAVENEKRHQPQYNQHIAPRNRQAIESYSTGESLSPDRDPRGRILDQYV
ncbi:MAG: hypothetical protein OEY09_00335 [Gammaproteobacteria bacterium]|nr:hypothetical protein [Gammaproteobacteria bacterium]